MDFICKKFSLNHTQSTMKVGTDAILLSSVIADVFKQELWQLYKKNIHNILDIGTGCGILSLCMAQIFNDANIIAIDIDEKSISEATNNFSNSIFSKRLIAKCESIQSFTHNSISKFDFIISNPPFFTSSLQSPNFRRNNARHNINLSIEDLTTCSKQLLHDNGYIAIILPEKEMEEVIKLFNTKNIHLIFNMNVFAKPLTYIKRKICIFKNAKLTTNDVQMTSLNIRTANNEYSKYYKQITSEFLL